MNQRKDCRVSCDVGKAAEGLENELWRRISDVRVGERGEAYVTAHSTALPLLHIRHRHFSYVTAHSPTLPPLYLNQSSFYNPSVASPTSHLMIQPSCLFIYATAHCRTPSVASPTSQDILQLFSYFTYVTGTSRTSPGVPPIHRGMKKQSVVD